MGQDGTVTLVAILAPCAAALLAWRWWLDERREELRERSAALRSQLAAAEASRAASDEAMAKRLDMAEARLRVLDERTTGWSKATR